ncbi:hypothetical protein [Streptomyces sp. BE230]|uniref:hypothetical protein n=1 Tax=Streptomyces sp. BE230 TaxID=3002526 RepID=UPI002ECFE13B|nr:hypothetical protein [Streptomyces sp. BE230]
MTAAGRLIWVSDEQPGATHDLTAARVHGLPAALTAHDLTCRAGKALQSVDPAGGNSIRSKPRRGRRRRHNRNHARIRSFGERAMAILKSCGSCGDPLQHHPDHGRRPSRCRPRTRRLIMTRVAHYW